MTDKEQQNLFEIYNEMFSNKEFKSILLSHLESYKIPSDKVEYFIKNTLRRKILNIIHPDSSKTCPCSPELRKRFKDWITAINTDTTGEALFAYHNYKPRPYYSLSNDNTVMTLDTSLDSNNPISLEIPEGIKIISREADITYPSLQIQNIHFPKSIGRVRRNTFRRQGYLKSINFADMSGSPVFEEQCFALCTNLKEINLPSHSILCFNVFGSRGFKIKFHYYSTMVFNVRDSILAYSLGFTANLNCENRIYQDTIIFEDDTISNNTFRGTEFFHVTFKNWDNVTIIKENVFNNTKGKTLYIEEENTPFRLPDNIKEIEDRAFYNSTMLPEKLTIPKSLTKLGKDAFTGSSLKTIECTPEQLPFIKQNVNEGQFEFAITLTPGLTTLKYEFKCEQSSNVQDITITLPSKMYVISCTTNDVCITAFVTNKPDELTDTVNVKYTSKAKYSLNAQIIFTVKQPN